MRLDIGWRDLFHGLIAAGLPGDRDSLQRALEAEWGNGDALACLSVRSGFDLLLRACRFPAGTEVLFSAITIRDMPDIAAAHGLVPVPVDLDERYRIDPTALERAWTPRTRVLVVAHLFGDRGRLDDVMPFARKRELLVVEDCAQAWGGLTWRGRRDADVGLFSFGSIKTATALGGALCRVNDAGLLAAMREIQSRDPVQPSRIQRGKVMKYGLLKGLSSRWVYPWFLRGGRLLGRSPDDLIGSLTRGFSPEDPLRQLRQRPSAPLLALLRRRMRTYDVLRILNRTLNGRRLLSAVMNSEAARAVAREHSFWVFPWLTAEPERLVERLRRHGFDAARRGRLHVIPAPPQRADLTCPVAHDLLDRTVLVPCYCEIPPRDIDRLAEILLESQETGAGDASLSSVTAAANTSPLRS